MRVLEYEDPTTLQKKFKIVHEEGDVKIDEKNRLLRYTGECWLVVPLGTLLSFADINEVHHIGGPSTLTYQMYNQYLTAGSTMNHHTHTVTYPTFSPAVSSTQVETDIDSFRAKTLAAQIRSLKAVIDDMQKTVIGLQNDLTKVGMYANIQSSSKLNSGEANASHQETRLRPQQNGEGQSTEVDGSRSQKVEQDGE